MAPKLIRPRIDMLPPDTVKQIIQLEQRFITLQRQMRLHVAEYDQKTEPQLIIPKITEVSIEFNNQSLSPQDQSLKMLELARDCLLDEGEDWNNLDSDFVK